jgi:phage gpG-like protein
MAKKSGVDSKQLADLQNKIEQLGKLSKQELSNELVDTATFMVAGMKTDARHKTGNLRLNIGFERQNQNTVVVFSKAPYSPYVEFGTGRNVDLQHLTRLGFPASYAAQFKGKGIKKVNLPARPFFFTNLRKELGDLKNRLETKIKQLTK